MTDAHCHVTSGETRHLLCAPLACEPQKNDAVFFGTHPWYLDGFDAEALRRNLSADPHAGVGEIGLDRLKDRTISPRMREIFETQLKIAAEFHRPVVLHGAKCWGDVVHTIQKLIPQSSQLIPSFLFHGFSRSDGLILDIVALNGYISVGPAILNDHAVNYREMVKKIPMERLLVESDRTPEKAAETPSVREIAAKLAEIRGVSLEELGSVLDSNAAAFLSAGI